MVRTRSVRQRRFEELCVAELVADAALANRQARLVDVLDVWWERISHEITRGCGQREDGLRTSRARRGQQRGMCAGRLAAPLRDRSVHALVTFPQPTPPDTNCR